MEPLCWEISGRLFFPQDFKVVFLKSFKTIVKNHLKMF